MTSPSSPPEALPHQIEGVRFLRERAAAALFDEQGLGKSKQLIDAISDEVRDGGIDAAVIICPNTLKTTWGQEIERHSRHRYAVFGAGKRARREGFRSLRATFYVINYEAVAAELVSLRALLRFRRCALVLDESHRVKTPAAKVTRAVHALRREAAKKIIMTGTPVANKPEDLWSQLFFLDDGLSAGATFEEFKARYLSATGGYVRLEELRERLSVLALRRKKEGTIDLPPKTFVRMNVALLGQQLAMYEQMRNELELWVRNLSGEEFLAQGENILSRLVRLSQLASNPGLLDATYTGVPAKFQALDRILDELLKDPSEKAIVWTSFVPNIAALMARYARLNPVAIHGEVDRGARDRAVAAFMRDSSVRLLVANPAAAREGLTLTEARTAVYLDRTFNLVDFLQSQDRIHRISQRRACEIVLLIAENTIDEFIDFTLEQKTRLARYAQGDVADIAPADLALEKPVILQALLSPGATG